MHVTPPPGPGTPPPRRLLTMLVIVVLAAMLGGPLQPAAGDPAPPPGGPAVASGSGLGQTYQVTLLTGDVVVLHTTLDGKQAAWVQKPANDDAPPALIYEQDGLVHVVPVEAQPYLASGVLDENLFNVTLLARQGYDDQARSRLPLLLEGHGTTARHAPAVPTEAQQVRELESVGMVSVTVDKSDIRSVWTSLRGTTAADVTAKGARLARAGKVWLNGPVRATLDDSVPQIGANEAWAAGYDGTGAQVAVLDTGYDPTHPDLAGRVVEARNFTAEEDPAGENAIDGNGHGTHVAATVAGSGAASQGARKGVAPGAELLVGKVLDSNGEGTWDQVIEGMEWAASSGADIVNMSLGTPFPSDGADPVSQAVNELTDSTGTLFVVAAGNAGPGEQTVGSPGAADRALTVGAVTKQDDPALFSSRGPRLGDMAIKPEVVAPGADIVAARAAGSSLGNLLDESYTSLSGTSMATPHVAGAAAILAQQHEDWGAEELKAQLISTSEALAGEPITFQGAGRVNVAAAIRDTVRVDDAVLSLGAVPQDSEPVTRTLTYRNPSDRAVKLRMSADVTGTGSDTKERPYLRFSRRVLTIPAGGQATVDVRLMPHRTEPGGYAGRIVAHQLRERTAVHTVMSLSVAGPMRTVTVNAVDRAGAPASGPVDLWRTDTGEWTRAFFSDGTATFEVPDGLYSLVANIGPAGSLFGSTSHTIAGNPELRVDRDVTLEYDARQARPLRVETHRDADLNRFEVLWNRTVGDRSMTMSAADGESGEQVYVLKSPPAHTGTFTLASQWQLTQPLLTAHVPGDRGFRLGSPELASPGFGGFCQCPPQTFVGEHTLRLVDAGTGTAEELAAADAEGAVALVSRRGEWGELALQAEAAADAGAELLLAHNTAAEPWIEDVLNAPLPVYRLDRETGAALLEALALDPELSLDLMGVSDATYQYELGFTEKRRIPAGRTYNVRPRSLAIVTSDYRYNSDRMIRAESWIPYFDDVGVANSMSTSRNGPVVRTEYVSTEGVQWQRFAQPHQFAGFYWTTTNPTQYQAGERFHQVWWGPMVHPAVPPAADGASAPVLGGGWAPVSRVRDAIRVNMPHYSFGGSLTSTIYEQFGDRSELTLRRDGDVVGKSTWPVVQFTVPPDQAEYELSLDVVNGADNWSDTSVATRTDWRFGSARTSEEGAVLPLVQLRYDLDANSYNEVPAGSSYPLVIEPGYQPGASGPGSFTVGVEVSYDDGATWLTAPVTDDGAGRVQAEIPAAPGSGFATVRVVATDSAGNRIDQRIDRAWRVSAS